MIYEFRTYTLHARTLPEFIKRWVPMIEKRQTYSKLAAFLYDNKLIPERVDPVTAFTNDYMSQ